MRIARRGLVMLALAWCSGCAASRPTARAELWPQADQLFRRDPRWLGSDAAFSVPMGDGRILWLFGDTFVARTAARRRAESAMVRNTVGIQTGRDPVRARMSFHWRETDAGPGSFFPEEDGHFYWPKHGIRLGRALLIFLSRVRAVPGGLGFLVDGWRAAIIDDASGSPSDWTVRMTGGSSPSGLHAGAALLRSGERVLSLAVREPGDHAGYLVRWTAADLAAGRLDRAEWWLRGRGWVPERELAGEPTPIMKDAGAECSLHHDARLGRFVHVRSEGFGATTIVVSFAERIEGPWSAPTEVFRPPESDRPHAFVYAAKAHPELEGAGLWATYATNSRTDLARLISDPTLYYPRFVRLRLRP